MQYAKLYQRHAQCPTHTLSHDNLLACSHLLPKRFSFLPFCGFLGSLCRLYSHLRVVSKQSRTDDFSNMARPFLAPYRHFTDHFWQCLHCLRSIPILSTTLGFIPDICFGDYVASKQVIGEATKYYLVEREYYKISLQWEFHQGWTGEV
jgi:hypothetical protein